MTAVRPRSRARSHAARARTERALHPLLVVALAWLALADIPTVLRVGPLSLSGLATLAAGAATLVLAPLLVLHGRGRSAPRTWSSLIPPGRRRPVVPIALVAFCGVALAGLVRSPTANGLQQTAVYLGFAGAIAVAALYSREATADRFLTALGTVMTLVGVIAIPVFLAGASVLWGQRSLAIAAVVAIAALVPVRSRHLPARVAPYVLTVAVAVSLSRTALVIAVLLLSLTILRSRAGLRGARIALALVVLVGVAIAAFLVVPSLRDRFLDGDNAVAVGGVSLNTSGRSQIWALVVQDALRAPWFGHGAGTASDVVAARFPFVAQPHDEPLRLWHDFGLLGLGLFTIAWIVLTVGAARRALRTARPHRAVHWSAAIALAAVGLVALTDNPFVYPFVMLPLGVIVGLSIGRRGLHPLEEERPPRRARAALAVRSGGARG